MASAVAIQVSKKQFQMVTLRMIFPVTTSFVHRDVQQHCSILDVPKVAVGIIQYGFLLKITDMSTVRIKVLYKIHVAALLMSC